jgi:uncharacterized protein
MTISLTPADVEPAIVGGMLLSAGGSGKGRVAKDRRFGEAAFALGPVALAPVDEIDPQAGILVATAVGAPGGGKHLAHPDHSVRAARQLLVAAGAAAGGVIPGHVPGIYAWLVAAALGVPLLDAACNGRGHPTVKMGSLGLSSQPHVRLFQSGVGANVSLTVNGNAAVTSHLMRAAAVQNGGLIMACRGPLEASLIRSAGAVGAIGYQLGLGRAVIGAGPSGQARVEAALRFTKGRLLASGRVVANTVAYRDGFDVGTVTVRSASSGSEVKLGVCNEFMMAEVDGQRIATFPDLMAAMDPHTGEALAISELPEGTPVAVLAVSKRDLPMGSGIYDPAVYPDVEQAIGAALARYALDPDA